TFTDTSTDSDGSIVSWSWNFGDGNTSTAQSPTHTYGADGTYMVSLTVADDDGATGSIDQSVTVGGGGSTVTVKSLDGSSVLMNKNFWRATVVATINPALAGAAVSGAWGDGSAATCTTDGLGQCSVSTNVRTKTGSITFEVDDVALAGYTYEASVTSVTVNQP
ncbi:MAG: PKD domain-containing protein, partial [Anaerolineae bacterium]|nr:PKD domain-containing protein [Anaerolineae bacterium]